MDLLLRYAKTYFGPETSIPLLCIFLLCFFQGLLIIKAGVSKFLDFSIYREHDIAFTIPTLFVEFSYF